MEEIQSLIDATIVGIGALKTAGLKLTRSKRRITTAKAEDWENTIAAIDAEATKGEEECAALEQEILQMHLQRVALARLAQQEEKHGQAPSAAATGSAVAAGPQPRPTPVPADMPRLDHVAPGFDLDRF